MLQVFVGALFAGLSEGCISSPIVLGTHGIAYHPILNTCVAWFLWASLDITEGKKALVLNAGFSQEAAWEPASGI
jgi:hypothetical protein